jgi:SAM-dependent methyltransferase
MPDSDVQAASAYEAMAETYAADREDQAPWNSLYERPAIVSMLPDLKGKRVLDVGCGTGPISAWAASRGAEVVGFDLTPAMVRLAEARGLNGVSFRVADLAQPLDFLEDGSFDVAVGSLVMHYLRDWVEPLRELRRVLRPDGILVISTHHPAWDVGLSKSGNYFNTELLHDRWTRGGKEFDVRFWRRPLTEMFAAFEQAGFNVLAFREPQPVAEFRERFPEQAEHLSTNPVFAIFKLAPAAAS